MMGYWAEFARTGTPGRGGDPARAEWTRWDESSAEAPKLMLLDAPVGGGLRMSNDVESREKLLAGLDADPRLPTQLAKCRVFHQLVAWPKVLTEDEYLKAGKEGCAPYPFDGYPWDAKQ